MITVAKHRSCIAITRAVEKCAPAAICTQLFNLFKPRPISQNPVCAASILDSFTEKDCICHSKEKVRGDQEHPCGNYQAGWRRRRRWWTWGRPSSPPWGGGSWCSAPGSGRASAATHWQACKMAKWLFDKFFPQREEHPHISIKWRSPSVVEGTV